MDLFRCPMRISWFHYLSVLCFILKINRPFIHRPKKGLTSNENKSEVNVLFIAHIFLPEWRKYGNGLKTVRCLHLNSEDVSRSIKYGIIDSIDFAQTSWHSTQFKRNWFHLLRLGFASGLHFLFRSDMSIGLHIIIIHRVDTHGAQSIHGAN